MLFIFLKKETWLWINFIDSCAFFLKMPNIIITMLLFNYQGRHLAG